MKKILVILLVLDILLLFCYCAIHNTSDTPAQSEGESTTSAAVTTTAETLKQPIVTTPTTTVAKDTTADTTPEKPAAGYFASYESILELCRIATEYFEYGYDNDILEEKAESLGLEDSTEKQWFLSIYYALGYYLAPSFNEPNGKMALGYAVKDLNGDGSHELVLLNDSYMVGAIFSMVDGKPLLLETYRDRHSAWIDENGWIHNNGSSGASYSDNTVYQVASGGASLEVIAGFGTNGFEWVGEEAVTIYYKLVNGEKVRITEDECGALAEQYGEYLGWEAGAAATKEKAGLVFKSLFETYLSQDVKDTWEDDLVTLLSKLDIHDSEKGIPGSYAVGLMDLNFDNTPEVLVAYPGGSMGNIWVHIYNLKNPKEPIWFYDGAGFGGDGMSLRLTVAKVGDDYVVLAEGSIRGRSNRLELLSNLNDIETKKLEAKELFGVGDSLNNPNQYFYMGERVEKSKYDEEYQKFLNDYTVFEETEITLAFWNDYDLSNKEQLVRNMAEKLLYSSQTFIDYTN